MYTFSMPIQEHIRKIQMEQYQHCATFTLSIELGYKDSAFYKAAQHSNAVKAK